MKIVVTLEVKKGDGPKQSYEAIESELENEIDGLTLYVADPDSGKETEYEVSFIKADDQPE